MEILRITSRSPGFWQDIAGCSVDIMMNDGNRVLEDGLSGARAGEYS
jgi:hypothetical protein